MIDPEIEINKAFEQYKQMGYSDAFIFWCCDACLTELTPEWVDENGEGRCTVGLWFKPLKDEVAHSISKKYQPSFIPWIKKMKWYNKNNL